MDDTEQETIEEVLREFDLADTVPASTAYLPTLDEIERDNWAGWWDR